MIRLIGLILGKLIFLILGLIFYLLAFFGLFLGIGMAFEGGDFRLLIAGIIGFVMLTLWNIINIIWNIIKIDREEVPRYSNNNETFTDNMTDNYDISSNHRLSRIDDPCDITNPLNLCNTDNLCDITNPFNLCDTLSSSDTTSHIGTNNFD
ncbi:hypothetical protein JCM14244_07950 [Venenivibrio stagnispumantis]|uniref:Uncharacterized protein n=1 Tax=Venenivibrio stagnispumantis TaxID=407998 RepID=A0AA45WNW1_9AQUI|nr:hypothetical protein [Venenivibrio stagnispumantis]MCW4573855.1 hypothetical protein [Venenivibrio stagnispumantis]SMP19303.1 hypothetical protein SAMN06264868_11913 [Venenivibrio stagnispumantis]